MSGLNWRKAQLAGKRSMSTLDEAEYRDRDAASRWLARNEKPAKKAGKKSKFVAASSSQAVANAGAAPSQTAPAPLHNTSAWSAS